MVKLVGLSAALVFLVILALACGGAESEVETTQGNSGSSGWGDVTVGVPYRGQVTMEEAILYAEAMARVRYISARQTVEEIRLGDPDRYSTLYANSLEITFEVLEYLKGSGGSEIKAVLYNRDGWRYTRAEVEALNENLIPLRTTVWDDREAIVFSTFRSQRCKHHQRPRPIFYDLFPQQRRGRLHGSQQVDESVASRCRSGGLGKWYIANRATVLNKPVKHIRRGRAG